MDFFHFPFSFRFYLNFPLNIEIENNFENSADIAFKVGIDHVHTSTINHRLREVGLKSNIAAAKNILTDKYRAAGRILFARRYVHQPGKFWRSDFYGPENLMLGFRRLCLSPSAEERKIRKRNILNIKRSGRTSVSVWGGIFGRTV